MSELISSKSLWITNVGKYKGKRETYHTVYESKLVQPLWKTLLGFIKKIKIELPHDLAIPLDIYLK